MSSKKANNIKNIVFLTIAAALAVGFIYTDKNKISVEDIIPHKAETVDEEITSEEEKPVEPEKIAAKTIILSASIPELSCGSVRFGENTVLFADSAGDYAFINGGVNSDNITVTDDIGRNVTVSNDSGIVSIQNDGREISNFVYNRHLIELKNNVIYYDSSPVEYKQTSFSAYKLSDDYTLECVDIGKYRLRNSDGKITNTCSIKESEGKILNVTADDSGFYAEGDNDGLFYIVFKINDDVINTGMNYHIYINGSELVPEGYDDKYVNPDAKSQSSDAKISAIKPPVNYGDVNVHNDNVSSLTIEMLSYVNEVREQYGLAKVYGLEILDECAQIRVNEISEKFEHKRPLNEKQLKDQEDGKEVKERNYNAVLNDANILWWYAAENIAQTQNDILADVFEAWLNSEEHRSNILDPNLKYMSLACTEKDGVYYWEQLFFNDTYVPY